ncbi:MAG: IS5 family transposase [Methanolinea sp.]|nr:IS5 family transposase [Methanolinea sp.]
MTFETFGLHEAYKRVQKVGDRLSEFESIIDWDQFRPILEDLYKNKKGKGGRPNIDPVVMVKLLVLQKLYNFSDPELERQVTDRISFRKFIGFHHGVPDFSTVWFFRERLKESGKYQEIWDNFQAQIAAKGLAITRGVIQDATIITADPGKQSSETSPREEGKTRRNKDGTWTKRGDTPYFGYKLHVLIDKENHLVRRIETTTASVHDSQVDLSMPGETVYRDRGYFGVKPRASIDKTMKRAVRGCPLTIKEKRRNRAISKTRRVIVRVFAVIKRTFHYDHVLVTTVERVHVKNVFASFLFNLVQLSTLKRKGAW